MGAAIEPAILSGAKNLPAADARLFAALRVTMELGGHVWQQKGEPCATRTRDTLLKRQVLFLAELTAHGGSISQGIEGVKNPEESAIAPVDVGAQTG